MKKIFISFVFIFLLLSIGFNISIATKIKSNSLRFSNIEALADEETMPDTYYSCYTGSIMYVMAPNKRYCGNCLYDCVNPDGDGFCQIFGSWW
jgi:hypothetical protein